METLSTLKTFVFLNLLSASTFFVNIETFEKHILFLLNFIVAIVGLVVTLKKLKSPSQKKP